MAAPPRPQTAAATGGYGVLDIPKAAVGGAISEAGKVVSAGGRVLGAGIQQLSRPIVAGINAAAGSEIVRPVVRSTEPLGGGISALGEKIADTESDAAKAAQAKQIVTGDLTRPDTWALGPGATSPMALALGAANMAGGAAPMLLGGLAGRGVKLVADVAEQIPGIAAKIASGAELTAPEIAAKTTADAVAKSAGRRTLAAGATIGGLQGAEGSGEAERQRIGQMDPADLAQVPGYQQRIAQGMTPDAARADLAQSSGDTAFAATLPVATLAGGVGVAPLLHDAQGVLSRVAGASVARRAAVGAALEAPVQAGVAVAQNAAGIAAANAATGEQRSVTENSAPIAGAGALMGAGFGAFGGIATRPHANVPHPDAAPGSLSDAANALHEQGASAHAATDGTTVLPGDGAAARNQAPLATDAAQAQAAGDGADAAQVAAPLPPAVPWINGETGEIRTPTDNEVKDQFHTMFDQASREGLGLNVTAASKYLAKDWGVEPARLRALRKDALAERNDGITPDNRAQADADAQRQQDFNDNASLASLDATLAGDKPAPDTAAIRTAQIDRLQNRENSGTLDAPGRDELAALQTADAKPGTDQPAAGAVDAQPASAGVQAENDPGGQAQGQRQVDGAAADSGVVRPEPGLGQAVPAAHVEAGAAKATTDEAGNGRPQQAVDGVDARRDGPGKVDGTDTERAGTDGAPPAKATGDSGSPPATDTAAPRVPEPAAIAAKSAAVPTKADGADQVAPKTPPDGGVSASGADGARFPTITDRDVMHSGPAGIALRKVAPGRPLHRETNAGGLDDLLRDDGNFHPHTSFVTDDPALALGQGSNKGVAVTFRPDSVSGSEHRKPGTGIVGGREYQTDALAPRAISAVRFASEKELKATRKLTRTTLGREFDRIDAPDGSIRFARKGLDSATEAPAKAADAHSPVETAALDSAAHPDNARPEPTPAQHEANNYKQGHVNLHGLDVTIQVPKGAMRRGTDRTGKAWERPASDHYGHVRGTDGGDGEPHDVYLGPHAEDANAKVFVIRQVKHGTDTFDESKAMIGFKNGREARKSYDANFPKGMKVFGGIEQMTLDDFKRSIGKAPASEPLPAQRKGERRTKTQLAKAFTEQINRERASAAVKQSLTAVSDKAASTAPDAERRVAGEGDADKTREAKLNDYADRIFAHADKEIGWEQVGGKILRGAEKPNDGFLPPVVGRTPWVGKASLLGESNLWRMRPDKINERQGHKALERAAAGHKLTPREQRFVDYARESARKDAEYQLQAEELDADTAEATRQEVLARLRDEDGIAIAQGDEHEAMTLAQLAKRGEEAGIDPLDMIDIATGPRVDYAGRLWRQVLEKEKANGTDTRATQSDRGSLDQALEGRQAAAAGEEAAKPGAEQTRQVTPARNGDLLPAPTARETVDAATRSKDAARDGKTGTGRTDMLSGDGELFAGRRPEQATVPDAERPTDSPAFKRFFDGSKVVSAKGEPLVVHHGTGEDFSVFDSARAGSSGEHATAALGHFFTTDRALAKRYAENASEGVPANEKVLDTYLALKKPYTLPLAEAHTIETLGDARALRARLEKEGYDGIRIPEAKSWVAFRSEQIKSVDNRGTFDTTNPDINFRRADPGAEGRAAHTEVDAHTAAIDKAAREEQKTWGPNAPHLRVIGSAEDLPRSAKTDPDYRTARGFYDPKTETAYVVGENVRDVREAMQTVAHEVIGHHGIEKILDEHVPGGFKRLVDDFDALRDSGKGSDAMRGVLADVERRYPNASPEQKVKEGIAIMAERGIRNGLIGRVVSAVRAYLRKLFPSLKFGDADLRRLLQKSERYVRTETAAKGFVEPVAAMSFAKRPSDDTGTDAALSRAATLSSRLRDATGTAAARRVIQENAIIGKPLTNIETGRVATVSRATLDKMLSHSASRNSDSGAAHAMAVANIDHLFEIATPRLSRADAAGNADVAAIHHFDAPMLFNGQVLRAKMLVKELTSAEQGSRIYSVAAVDVVKPASSGMNPANKSPTSNPPAGFESKFAQLADRVKGVSSDDSGSFSKPAASMDELDHVLAQPDPSVLDRAKEWLRGKAEDFRPAALGALQRRQLTELMADHPALKTIGKQYDEDVQRLEADRNQLITGTADAAEHPTNMLKRGGAVIAEDLRKFTYEKGPAGWFGRRKPEAKALFDVMHDATLYGLDPSEDYQRLQFEDSRGDGVPWTKEGIKERIKALRDQMRGRPGDDKNMFYDEIKRLRGLPARERLREQRYPELVARWNALPDQAKTLYTQQRDWHNQHRDEMEKALIKRIDAISREIGKNYTRSVQDRIRLQFEAQRRDGVFFPLNRDGDYWVSFTDKKGEAGFKMFETAKDASAAERKLRESGFKIDAQGRRDSNYKAKDAPAGTFVRDVVGLLAKSGAPEKVQDEVYQMFLKSLPEMSMRKHSIHRKGIPGFSDDALRAFAKNAFHGAHQLARLRHSHELTSVVEAGEEIMNNYRKNDELGKSSESSALNVARGDALLAELRRRHDYIMSPTDSQLANKANAIGFLYYLGASPASALVNLTQNAQVTLPVLGAHHGWAKAAPALTAAMRDSMRTFGNIDRTLTNPDERRAYNVLRSRGDIDKTQGHTLAGVAEGNMLQTNPVWSKAMSGMSFMFHKAEVINREAAGMAAYRLATKRGDSFADAVKYASDIINGTHFDYSAANRPRIMQGNAARVALQFKNYSVGMTWMLYRNLYQSFKAEDPAVRAVARKTLTGILGTTALMSGTMGLPVINAIKLAANANNALFGDDTPFDFDTEYRQWLSENLGETAGKVIADGAVNPLGANFARRVSLSNLWFQDADKSLEGKDAYYALLESMAGPLGGMVKNLYVGQQMASEGNVQRGIETMMPKFAKDAMKATRFAHDGANTLRGDPILPDVSGPEAFIQALGFQPTRLFEQQTKNNALKNYEQAILDRRQSLMNAYAMAVRSGDDRDLAMSKIHDFNAQYPEIALKAEGIRQSLRARARYSANADGGVAINKKLAPRLREMAGVGQGAQQ